MTDFKAIRSRFDPEETTLLFVGESPPSKGGFFYLGDSQLVKHTRTAYECVFGPVPSMSDFLVAFRSRGCYLTDLSETPTDDLGDTERVTAIAVGVGQLRTEIVRRDPWALVAIGGRVAPQVLVAAVNLPQSNRIFELPFGGNGHQNHYIDQLAAVFDTYWPLAGDR